MERRRGGPSRRIYVGLAAVSGIVGAVLVAASLAASPESSGGSVLLPGILLLAIGAVNVALALGLVGPPQPK